MNTGSCYLQFLRVKLGIILSCKGGLRMKRRKTQLIILSLISVLWIEVNLFLGVLPFSFESTAHAFSAAPPPTPTPSSPSANPTLQSFATLLLAVATIPSPLIR